MLVSPIYIYTAYTPAYTPGEICYFTYIYIRRIPRRIPFYDIFAWGECPGLPGYTLAEPLEHALPSWAPCAARGPAAISSYSMSFATARSDAGRPETQSQHRFGGIPRRILVHPLADSLEHALPSNPPLMGPLRRTCVIGRPMQAFSDERIW